MTLYSDEVKQIIRSQPWPRDLAYEIEEIYYPDRYLQFRLFRDNFETFDGVDKERIAKLVGLTIFTIRQKGCPCYLEVAKGDGKSVSES